MGEDVKVLKDLVNWCEKMPSDQLKWRIERLESFEKALFTYSKFKVGNRIKLAKAPIITEKDGWGWLPYKDILVEGAIATVTEVDYYNKGFRYILEFQGIRSGFCFREEFLKPFHTFKIGKKK